MQPTANDILNFILSSKCKGLAYSTASAARLTLSAFTTLEGYDVGKHPLVCYYMKGLHNLKTTLPKYSFTWDVGTVLKYWSTNNSVFDLSGKLETLLVVLCGQRGKRSIISN